MRKRNTIITLSLAIFSLFVGMGLHKSTSKIGRGNTDKNFTYTFDEPGQVTEAGGIDETTSPYWWVNSGAYLNIHDGIGETVQGDLPQSNQWRFIYSKDNPTDTDNGYHPQNLFRLITRKRWENYTEESSFLIVKDNVSKSLNRNESNGLLLFMRYKDENNLYYAGLRVDGAAVIKKKLNGTYYILGEVPVFQGSRYDRAKNISLLPKNTWISMRSEISTLPDKSVNIKLFYDVGKTGEWTLLLDVVDNSLGGAPILGEGHAGIRTDFMDVRFDDYKVESMTE